MRIRFLPDAFPEIFSFLYPYLYEDKKWTILFMVGDDRVTFLSIEIIEVIIPDIFFTLSLFFFEWDIKIVTISPTSE